MNVKPTPALAIIAAAVLAAGCSSSPAQNTRGLGGGDYARAQARSVAHVEEGIVQTVRAVRLDAAETGAKNAIIPAVGALAGGALGSQVGKGDGKTVAAVLGALAGGYAGHAVQQSRDSLVGLEITVRTSSRLLVVTQADEGIGFRAGDRVRVINDGRVWRVAPQ